jgi:hypothetical protein
MDKTRLTVLETSELVGISKSTLYTKYISGGLLSKSKFHGKTVINLDEIYSVFPELEHKESAVKTSLDSIGKIEQQNELLNQQIQFQQELIEHYKQSEAQSYEREKNLQRTIDYYQQSLTHQKTPVAQPEQSKREKTLAIIRKNKMPNERML